MNLTVYTLSAALLLAGAAWAQDPPPDSPPPGGQPRQSRGASHGQPRPPMDPMAEYLFPPDLIMNKAQDIGLSEDQRHAIQEEMQKIQTQFGELHKKLQGEMEALVSLVKQEKVDEDKVRSQLDKVLSAESEIKKSQLSLMVRIKNQLTGQQQGQLRELRKQIMPFGGPGMGDEERARMMMEQQRRQGQSRDQKPPGGPSPDAPPPGR